MASYPTHARQCLDLAAAAAPGLLSRAMEQAVASLQQEEDRAPKMAQRQELADAWLALTRNRADWSQRYAELLRTVQLAPPRVPEAPAPETDDRFGGFTLVEEDTVTREIEGARLLQLLASRVEQPLAELDAFMSTALGLDTVQPERNPLRPQVFTDALGPLMQPETQPELARLWSRHLAAPLATELEAVYRDALKLLQEAHVEAATYRVLPSAPAPLLPSEPPTAMPAAPHPVQGGGWGGGGDAAGATASPGQHESAQAALSITGPLGGASWADLSGYPLGDELFQNFLFSRAQPSTQALAPAYYAKVDAQLAAMQQAVAEAFEAYDAEAARAHRELVPVERPHRPVATSRGLDDAAWGRWAPARERSLHRSRLKKEARQVGQVLGLEVVHKLVDQVAQDARLLAPVREAVVALEPALARLALVAPRFFAQEDHAGRRLVERVAERSFRYNDEFTSEFHAFFEGVRTAFQALNECEQVADDAPFAKALGDLEQRWSQEDAAEEEGRKVAFDAVHFAEAREAEAAQIAWGMSQRSDLDGTPAVVQDFLFGPWSLVIAHARLTDTQPGLDPGGWNAIITDLLWSVKTDQTLRDPARLFTTVPPMLEKLRGGLALLGQDPAQHAMFFAALEKLHRPVLKLRAKSRHANHNLAAEPQLDAALLSTRRQQPRPPGGAPWLTPKELRAAGFEEDRTSAPVPLEPASTDDPSTAVIAGLRQGCWVDLYVREGWRRASLTWVSARSTLFMFVSHGGQPHSMTRRSLERLVRERLLRPVDATAVVPRAIESLSQQQPGREAPVPPRHRSAGELAMAA